MAKLYNELIKENVADLLNKAVHENEFIPWHNKAIPSVKRIAEIIENIRTIIFPGYFGDIITNTIELKHYIANNLDRLEYQLIDQVHKGICFNNELDCVESTDRAQNLVQTFLNRLPEIKRLISTDV